MKKHIKTIIYSLLITLTAANAFSQVTSFNERLTKEESAKLNNGETVIKNIDSYKKLSLNDINPATSYLFAMVKELKPSFTAEVIKFYPYEGNENLIELLDESIMDVKSYIGIPYYSERKQRYYDLYGDASIESIKERADGKDVIANLYMSVFGNIHTQITINQDKDWYFYENLNLNKLEYHEKFTAINEKKMRSSIICFKDGDHWVLYGLGGCAVPDLPFVHDRVQTSFMNRITTFCSFIFGQIEKKM